MTYRLEPPVTEGSNRFTWSTDKPTIFGYCGYGHNLSNFVGLTPQTAAVLNFDFTNRRKVYRIYIDRPIYIYIYYYCRVALVEAFAVSVNGNKKFISDKITTNISVVLFKIHFVVVITDRCGLEELSRYND
jgi:hypothetical protein